MNPRWFTDINRVDNFVKVLNKVFVQIKIQPNKRGRPPKHPLEEYLKLIIVKEFKRRSLRATETDYSELVCKERVDHSVIHFWEKKVNKELLEKIISLLGKELDKHMENEYTFIDSTEFTSWTKEPLVFHVSCRITKETVYPIGIFYGRGKTVKESVEGCLVEGSGDLLADAWYDSNEALGLMVRLGYKPIVRPNKERLDGYFRRRVRRFYRNPIGRQKYRQRGRGESLFGSLTNEFGDRLLTRRIDTSQVRIGCRIISYQLKILMRIGFYGLRILFKISIIFRNY